MREKIVFQLIAFERERERERGWVGGWVGDLLFISYTELKIKNMPSFT